MVLTVFNSMLWLIYTYNVDNNINKFIILIVT